MSQTNCECFAPSVAVPVTGLTLNLSQEALAGIGGGAPGGVDLDYSLEEQWAGKHWIDGSKIYQKTVECGQIIANGQKSVAHNIENVGLFVKVEGFATGSTVNTVHLPHVGARYYENSMAVAVSSTAILMNTMGGSSASFAGYNIAFVTLFYTCTDR
jgi:hypothetical protein